MQFNWVQTVIMWSSELCCVICGLSSYSYTPVWTWNQFQWTYRWSYIFCSTRWNHFVSQPRVCPTAMSITDGCFNSRWENFKQSWAMSVRVWMFNTSVPGGRLQGHFTWFHYWFSLPGRFQDSTIMSDAYYFAADSAPSMGILWILQLLTFLTLLKWQCQRFQSWSIWLANAV